MRLFGKSPEVNAAREQHAQLLAQIASTEGDASSLLAQLPAVTQAAELSAHLEEQAALTERVAQRGIEVAGRA
jgi:hypothetical protein